ncbi:DNA-processing protein DprA [Thalassotalea psychrophila]|uniref:DNA-processing protein DprA n=1 Tax=Thalassotalea psychrophila TaxID=3065647 RepID=A0ABY9TUZ8_9GAMM|nr:DNA-processing protein DprA [Colwelliaceae bacterium SQ149]
MSEQLSNAHYWLAWKLIPRLASNIKINLLNEFGLAKFFQLSKSALTSFGLNQAQTTAICQPNWSRINAVISCCQQYQITIIGIQNKYYPELLKQTENPPILLFGQGNLSLLNQKQLAMVGSRSATLSARESAKKFAYQLSSENIVITSGLALGIDSAAHQGALLAEKSTIAVVGTGLDIVYPARNKPLAKDILACDGAIISEYLPGTRPNPGCFPKRNRIITGMSLGVFVIEAQLKSGSLISARMAIEQNREVFAMPGAINNPQSKGCHSLIKQGATLVDEVEDILFLLDLPSTSGLYKGEAKREQKKHQKSDQQDLFIDPLLRSVDYETTSVDTVVSRSQLPTEEVLTRLMTLELRGLVTAVPGGYIKLN